MGRKMTKELETGNPAFDLAIKLQNQNRNLQIRLNRVEDIVTEQHAQIKELTTILKEVYNKTMAVG